MLFFPGHHLFEARATRHVVSEAVAADVGSSEQNCCAAEAVACW